MLVMLTLVRKRKSIIFLNNLDLIFIALPIAFIGYNNIKSIKIIVEVWEHGNSSFGQERQQTIKKTL